MTFDPQRRLVMANFKTVLGHNLPAGTPLVLVEEPTARGEVDEALARRLFNGRNAVYAEDARPTPVETPEQEKARLAAEALRDADDGDVVVMEDLLVWQADDAEAKKKAGAKVTKDDLILIAGRESVVIETDDNKPDLIRKITERRAAAAANLTYSQSDTAANAGLTVVPGASGPESDARADGDAHGAAGEGDSDTAGAVD